MTSVSDKLREWAAANPSLVLGLLALILYVELRVPTEVFYRHFGVTADEAGFGSIEVALLQSAQLLFGYALIGLSVAVVYLVLVVPLIVTWEIGGWAEPSKIVGAAAMPLAVIGAILLSAFRESWLWLGLAIALLALSFFLPSLFFRGLPRQGLSVARRRAVRSAPTAALVALAATAVVLPAILIGAAGPAAEDAKRGEGSDLFIFPWSSHQVRAVWKSADRPLKLPDCAHLLYLGEDNSRVLLYDSRASKTLRLNAADVELAFPDSCDPQPAGKDGGGKKPQSS